VTSDEEKIIIGEQVLENGGILPTSAIVPAIQN